MYEEPPAAGDTPPANDHRYPIGRNRFTPGGGTPVQDHAPAFGGRPVDRVFPPVVPGSRPHDMGPAEDAPQHGMTQGDMSPGQEGMDQDPGPYEDGNPEEVPPPDSLSDD